MNYSHPHELTPAQIAKLQRLRAELPFFAEHCLSIRTKSGSIEPFVLNRAKLYIHERLEAQKARTGKVRAPILKGRQHGCSTYVAGVYPFVPRKALHRRPRAAICALP